MENQNPPPGYWQHNPFPPEKPPHNPVDLWKVVGINFGIFLGYQALFVLIAGSNFLLADILPLVVHWVFMIVLMIVAFASGKKMQALGHLISLIVLVIIGFGSCFWIADMVG
jgi:hypothetical protein